MKKLPIGIQTFRKVIEENYIYIDKTKEALELIDSYSYAFLSRPRRFGKSLFIDTLHTLFEGNKSLFEGLYIYDKWDWQTKYPVIKISWGGKLRSTQDLEAKTRIALHNNQTRLGITCFDQENMAVCFEELIQKAYEKYNQKVVVLIDEYDKPILDNLDQMEQAKENREYIKGLYSVLKESDEYLKFVFLTGVSKFSKSSIFSGLNMLTDISLQPKFGNICGYTHEDVQNHFVEYLDDVDQTKLKSWYNGYNFLKDSVYNPFDILQFFANDKVYKNYWFATGTPTFLIKLIEKNNYFLPELSNIVVGEQLLDSFDVENIKLEVILYQSGYLTIEKMIVDEDDDILYALRLPNLEVQKSFHTFILNTIYADTSLRHKALSKALREENLEDFRDTLISLFASIPYHHYTNNTIQTYEGFYASVVYVYLQSLGLEIIGEDVTNRGRIDLTVKISNRIYIIEFKMGDSDALSQIKSKNYHQKYLNENKTLYLVGINFDEKSKNIGVFEWEKI